MKKQDLLNNKPVKYVIGKIIGLESHGRGGGKNFNYEFYLDDKLRKSEIGITNELASKSVRYLRKNYIGKKFIVKYSCIDTSTSEMILDFPIINTNLLQPKMGWDSIPFIIVNKKNIDN